MDDTLDSIGIDTFDTSGDIGSTSSFSPPTLDLGVAGSSVAGGNVSSSSSALLAAGIFPDSTGIMGTGSDATNNPNGSGSSGFLSGLGDLFSGIGAGVGAGIQGSNVPRVPVVGSGWQWNAATGTYYNPATGQTMTATGTITSLGGLSQTLGGSNLILLAVAAVVAFLLFRRRD